MERAEFARTNRNGSVVITRPTYRWPFITAPDGPRPEAPAMTDEPMDRAGAFLLFMASMLLTSLATAMGIVSWHAQFAYVESIKHSHTSAALEALGLDLGAVIFAMLGIALARLGRRAVIERALVCICAAGSAAMNLGLANLGSPRSIGVYVMPPVLFAITSDRIVSVIRRQALGRKDDDDSQSSAWRIGGLAFLYLLRLIVAPPSTAKGARLALLNATPLPELPAADEPAAIEPARRNAIAAPRPSRRRRSRGRKPGPTKTQRLLDLVAERHGPLSDFPLADVSRVATGIAPEVGIHAGSARTALRAAVLAAQYGRER
jgi:hypothetical protein